MKYSTIATFAMAGALLAGTAFAQDKLKAEVSNYWTSGGEAAAAKVLQTEFDRHGGEWSNSSVAGIENSNAAFQNRMAAGDPPTARQFTVGFEPKEYIKQGMLASVNEVATADKWSTFLPKPLLQEITYDGKIFLAPVNIHGASWMFYSQSAFDKAGIKEAPKSWDEFFADMDKLKAAGIIPIAWGGQTWQELKVFNAILVSQLGLEGYKKVYVDKDEATMKSSEFAKSLEIFRKMQGYIDEGSSGRNWNDATAMVITGKAGVQFMGDWAKGEFTAANQTPGKDYGCAVSPGQTG